MGSESLGAFHSYIDALHQYPPLRQLCANHPRSDHEEVKRNDSSTLCPSQERQPACQIEQARE